MGGLIENNGKKESEIVYNFRTVVGSQFTFFMNKIQALHTFHDKNLAKV